MPNITASKKFVTGNYDFAVQGGAISTINLGGFVPPNSVLIFGYACILTTLTSGGSATIAVGVTGTTNKLLNATAVASWVSTPGSEILLLANLSSVPLKILAEEQITATIATATITAGKFYVYLEYVEANS